MWEAIPGITKNSAPIISELYTLEEIFSCETDEQCNDLRDDIRDLRFPSGTRIGKQADKIADNFRTDEARDITSVKVLCAIPRVTEAIAKAIVEKYNIYELCDPKCTPGRISDLDVECESGNKTRKIGPAMSKKIIDILQFKK
jgi:hypothetical protein